VIATTKKDAKQSTDLRVKQEVKQATCGSLAIALFVLRLGKAVCRYKMVQLLSELESSCDDDNDHVADGNARLNE